MFTHKLILWTPRILSMILIVLMFMLSFDVFESDDIWYMLILGFLIHNIPVFILTIALIVAWKHPLIGAFVFMGAGLFYAIFMFVRGGIEMISSIFILGIPAILIGCLFWLTHRYHLL